MSFVDYREILKNELLQRQQKNALYSLRSFARDLNISPSLLSEVLSGKHGLSNQSAKKISEKLFDLAEARQRFCLLVKLAHSKNEKEKIEAQKQLLIVESERERFLLKMDSFRVISDWYHFAILSLLETRDFCPNEAWIAKRLAITPLEVGEALNRLERLELIQRIDGKISLMQNRTITPDAHSSQALRKLHTQILEKSKESIYQQKGDLRHTTAKVLAVPKSKVGEAQNLINEFRAKFSNLIGGDNTSSDEVYCLSINFFSLTETR